MIFRKNRGKTGIVHALHKILNEQGDLNFEPSRRECNLTGIISVYNNNIKIKGVMTFKIKGTKNMQLTLNIKTFVRNFP